MSNSKVFGKLFSCIFILSFFLIMICGCKDNSTDGEENKYNIRYAKENIRLIRVAVADYYEDTGNFPEKLKDLVEQPPNTQGWRGRYLKNNALIDPWGNDYVIEKSTETDFIIICYGADGKPGGDGASEDISL